jgi:hypothetical protein
MKRFSAVHCIGLGSTLVVATIAFVLLEPSPVSFGVFVLVGLPGFVLLMEGLE